MRKFLIVSLGFLLLGGVTSATVINSVHDFSTGSSGVAATAAAAEQEVCKFCHAPHNNQPALLSSPLWNHDFGTTATFTVYASDTMDGAPADIAIGGDNPSYLCMSCHDGTVAIGQLVNETIDMDTNGNLDDPGDFLVGTLALGADLSNDHPVNFDATADTTITVPATYPLFGVGNLMHCATCHDAHDNTGNPILLRGTLPNSQICMDCHTTK